MRAFVAVVPEEEALAPLVKRVPSLRERWPELGWIAPERWHLTLCFLGEVEERITEVISGDLEAITKKTPRMSAQLGVGGTFPGGRRPRVVWVGVEVQPELAEMATEVAQAARRAGIDVDSRAYKPHITVARVRRDAPSDPEGLRRALDGAKGRSFAIDQLVLLRSFLGPRPRYEEIGAWPLAGS
jgi:RNA 2',3'-cyclic 3'-phosphodiesterase